MFRFFGHKACGILAPWPGIEPALPALEGEVLTAGLPGKSLVVNLVGKFSVFFLVGTLWGGLRLQWDKERLERKKWKYV